MRRSLLLAALAALFAGGAAAQTFTTPQTVQQTLATNTACTGTAQNFNAQNLGQTQHFFYITWSVPPTNSLAVIQGIDNAGNVSVISDAGQGQVSTTGTTSALFGIGYFPITRIQVTCTGGTFTIAYAGTSATGYALTGASLATLVDKNLLVTQAANANAASQIATPPFGNSAGYLVFQYSGTGPAGSTLVVQCGGSSPTTNIGTGHVQLFTVTPQTAAVQQIFPIPATPCPFYNVQYNSGGASAVTFNLEYLFIGSGTSTDPCISGAKQPPAVINTTASAQIITGTPATNVYVCSIIIVVGAADNVALVEGTGATCGTGTAGMSGGATAATGWNLSANEAIQMTGPNTIALTATRGDNVCLLVSSAAQVSGTITFAKL